MNNRSMLYILLVITLASTFTHACDVPVYRYALERWAPDSYETVLFHSGPLGLDQQNALARFPKTANVRPRIIDMAHPIPPDLQAVQPQTPNTLILRHVHSGVPIWSAPFTAQSINQLMQSPARQTIARRLLDGDSAVWVQLESGDLQRDDAIETLLKTQLDIQARTLKLPVENPALQIAFSTLRLSRNDPQEQAFIRMLITSEWDLADRAQPMVFVIFGRGRLLYALIGAGITPDNIQNACAFLIGPCACEIKDDNPGIDLLINADWQANIQTLITETSALPSVAQLSQAVSTDHVFKPVIPQVQTSEENPFIRNIGLALLIGIGGIVGATVLIYMKKS